MLTKRSPAHATDVDPGRFVYRAPMAKSKNTPPKAPPAPAFEAMPPEVAAFCARINTSDRGDADLEGYAAFNEQYKPSDWTRNPAADTSLLTFAMDGAGGQFALWRQADRALLDCPVVQLGDDGDARVLARDFASFCALVAAGVNLFAVEDAPHGPRSALQTFVRDAWPGRDFGDVATILQSAAAEHPAFAPWLMSLTAV